MYFITEIISGGAEGADSLAKEFAEGMMVPFKEIRPDYEAYASNPRIAPLARNKCMVAEADIVVAFWDGKSRGTKFTIDAALDAKKPVFIIPF